MADRVPVQVQQLSAFSVWHESETAAVRKCFRFGRPKLFRSLTEYFCSDFIRDHTHSCLLYQVASSISTSAICLKGYAGSDWFAVSLLGNAVFQYFKCFHVFTHASLLHGVTQRDQTQGCRSYNRPFLEALLRDCRHQRPTPPNPM